VARFPKKRVTRAVLPVKGFFVIALAVVAAACGPGAAPIKVPTTIWTPIGSWSGTTSMQGETFGVDAHEWRIYWETKNEASPGAGTFVVHLHSGDSGRILGTPLRRSGAGTGVVLVTEPPRPNFYLSFEATNLEWSVRVEEPVAAERTISP
jgi:hypothetical protein